MGVYGFSRPPGLPEFTDFHSRRGWPKTTQSDDWECADFQGRRGYQNVWIFKAAGVAGRVAVTSIDFGNVFVRVLRRKVHLGLAAGGQVEFHDKPKFCSCRLCTVKNVSPSGFGTAGGQS